MASFLQAADFRLLLHGDFAICLRPRFVHREPRTTMHHRKPLTTAVTLKNNSEFLPSEERMQSKSKESSLNEEESFPVRKLEISDKRKGFIDLLQQLIVCDSVSDKEFEGRFQELSLYGDDHLVCVIEDNCSGKIVATGSVFIEKKFLRNCGQVGHIEDVVVDSNARGMQLGKKIIAFLSDHARSMGCYKVILDCRTNNKVFYEKCGFKQNLIQMEKYFT